MAISTLHTLGAVVVSGSGAFNLDGITDVQVNPNLALNMEQAGGAVDTTHISVMKAEPMISVTFTDIKTALAQIGINGMCFPNSTTITTVDFYFTKMAQCTPRASGASHFKVRLTTGLAVPNQISVSQDGRATMTVDFHAIYDGTNEPFIYTNSVSLPHVPSVDELYTVGKASINGSTLDGVTGMNINFGLSVEKIASEGDYRPTFVGIPKREPSIELTTKTVPALNTFGVYGTAQTSTDSLVYLRAITENGTRVADATTSHISFSIDDGIITCGSFGGSNNASSQGTVTIHPTYDTSNAVVVVTTDVAIA